MPQDHEKAQLAADYDDAAPNYEEHWGPALAELGTRFVEQLPLAESEAILEVGAGTGATLRYLADATEATVYGMDRSFGMLRRAPADARVAVMDAEALGFRDEVFDAVVALFMLFHLHDPVGGLREMRRVLTHGGIVAFTTWGEDDPNCRAFEVWDEVLDRHGAAERRALFARHDLTDSTEKCVALLEEASFEVASVHAAPMEHRWTVDDFIRFRTEFGIGRVRWQSLDGDARAGAGVEGRKALEQLPADELVLRDEVIYSVGRAA